MYYRRMFDKFEIPQSDGEKAECSKNLDTLMSIGCHFVLCV